MSRSQPPFLLSAEQVVAGVRQLPSAPKVLPRLKQLLCNPNSSMDEIVSLIRFEPAIAARVLQVSNSAFHSKGSRCATVDEAVNRVGYAQVYELVMYAVASQVLVRPLVAYRLEADELWKMSVTCGLAAEMIASRVGEEPDVAYTMGLFHGIGMVVIDFWAMKHAPTLTFAPAAFPAEWTDSERAALGCVQAEVGAVLLKQWEFPAMVHQAVRWQDSPLATTAYVRSAALVHAAKWVRAATHAADPSVLPLAEARFLAPLGLQPEQLQEVAEQVKAKLEDVKHLLEIQGDADVSRVPGRAAHLL